MQSHPTNRYSTPAVSPPSRDLQLTSSKVEIKPQCERCSEHTQGGLVWSQSFYIKNNFVNTFIKENLSKETFGELFSRNGVNISLSQSKEVPT